MIFKPRYDYKSIDSTNRKLKELAEHGAPEGTVVLASQQTSGRGRMGRSFFSPPDYGLYLSILYKPELSETCPDPLSLTMLASVAVLRAIQSVCHITPGIKWVNDLYYQGKKIAGILAEGIIKKNRISSVILGTGINLWEPPEGYPQDIASIAGSIFGPGIPDQKIRNELADALIKNLYPIEDSPDVLKIYRNNSIVLGKKVTLTGQTKTLTGIVSDFTENGALIMLTEDNKKEILHSGEISLRFPTDTQ